MLAPPKSFKHAGGPATMGGAQGMVQPMPASLCAPARPTGMARRDPVRPLDLGFTLPGCVFHACTDTGQGCGFATPVASSGVGDE